MSGHRAIVVVGAANVDLISYVPRLPRRGETLHANDFEIGFGGKGANQAVMAARLGSPVSLVTRLGVDTFGDDTLENLRVNGVDTTHVHRTDGARTGVAPIVVDADGANSIIIIPGANARLTSDELEAARPAIAAAAVLVCQLELPLELTRKALTIARQEGTMTLLNAAPAMANLPDDLYEHSDVLCANEVETELLTGGSVADLDDATQQAQQLLRRGVGSVVLTLGERGCLVVQRDATEAIPGKRVEVVDTAGAGDAFVGALAHHLAHGMSLRTAATEATSIAAMTVMARGTQASFPDPLDLT